MFELFKEQTRSNFISKTTSNFENQNVLLTTHWVLMSYMKKKIKIKAHHD